MSNGKSGFKAYDYIESRVQLDIEMTIGEFLVVDVRDYNFKRIYQVTYEGLPPNNGEIAITEIITLESIVIVTSASPNSEWLGKKVKCKATISGLWFYEKANRVVVIPPFWYFLLTEAIRLINNGENNLTIIICATAFETFLSEFIADKIQNSETWLGLQENDELERFYNSFITGPDGLRMNDKIKIFIKSWLGIHLTDETVQNWNGKVRSRRNQLVHALTKRQFGTKEALEAFHASCLIIHEILTTDADEEFIKSSYTSDLAHWIDASIESIQRLEKAEA